MKMIPYATQWVDEGDINAVVDALKSSHLTQGPLVDDFESAVASYCGAKYAVAVNSGTSALHIACLAAGVKEGDEVITSPITFVASANCAIYCGAKPVFADINSKTVCIDPKEIEKKISVKTKAIVPVDFAGVPADLKVIKAIARKTNLIVIEDASHALGASYGRKKIGSGHFADMTVFSFHAVKQVAAGEGGMVLTNNKILYKRLIKLRTHGITRDRKKFKGSNKGMWYYEMQDLGFNYRITDIQCALGISQFQKLDQFLKQRKTIVEKYNKAFREYEEISFLDEQSSIQSAHHLYVLRFKQDKFSVDRQVIFDEYRRERILVNVHYIPVYHHPFYKNIGYKNRICPKAEEYYKEAITLPLFPKMTNTDVRRVIKVTKEIIHKYRK